MKMTKLLLSILTLVLTFNALTAQNPSDKELTVRVLTFNILHGATTKNDFDLDKIASIIQNTNPDLVAMQEVDFKTNRARNYDLVTELGWRTKMAPLFGIAMPYDGGGYGEGILSKMPILSSRNVALPHSPDNEPRTALQVLVQLESGDTISFIGTHLEHQETSTDRIDQVKTINQTFAYSKYPSILAGDLNATPNSEPISILKRYWTASDKDEALTYPSEDPEIKIDYIFFRPSKKWQVVETEVICDEIASDHCAVLSVLRLVK
nr:endonuclease/exonuclease/phosphatase family protein [uncultured Draconibacterium sp.]